MMNELHLPFVIYQRHDEEDHYSLKEVYIHKTSIKVKDKMPSKTEQEFENQRVCNQLQSCWIAIFIYRERCFTLTSKIENPQVENPAKIWMKKEYVMRFNPRTTSKTTDFITNSVDLVVPLTSRLDAYCPVTHHLVSTTLLFSNYMTYPIKILMKDFDQYMVVFKDHWNKIMKETIGKNKIFCLPLKNETGDRKEDKMECIKMKTGMDLNQKVHLSHNKLDAPKTITTIDSILNNIKNDQSHQYAKIKRRKV